MNFNYPDPEKDKYEEEIMERYGPGRFIVVKCTTEEGLEKSIHDYLVHDWERAGNVYTRKGGWSTSDYYCQMVVKKEKEPEPKEEKIYTSSSSVNIDDGSFTRVMRYIGSVSEFNKGKKKEYNFPATLNKENEE